MAVLLITYDLNKETTRPPIVKKIKDTYDNWAQLSESSYAVETNSSPSDVHNTLKPLIDSNDQIYIIALKAPYAGFGPEKVNKWLDEKLTH